MLTLHAPRRAAGFSLVELMIALVLGLILVGAVLSLVVASMRANAENVQSTRLNQELRALAEIIGREVRRARFHKDAMTNIGRGDDAAATYDAVTITDRLTAPDNDSDGDDATTDGDCVLYSYQDAPGGAFRGIWLGTAASPTRGAVLLARGSTARVCGTGGSVLNSQLVDITRLSFNWNPATDALAITIEGRLVGDTVVRRFSDVVRIRSEDPT
jgi:prepilin-type N-terminal cleavage/methylation domain-containing protein